jgi:hypothetical protein
MSGGKVVHVSEAIHKKAFDYCTEHNLFMSSWVEYLIASELDRKSNISSNLDFIKKSKIVRCEESKVEDIWNKPPFWENK